MEKARSCLSRCAYFRVSCLKCVSDGGWIEHPVVAVLRSRGGAPLTVISGFTWPGEKTGGAVVRKRNFFHQQRETELIKALAPVGTRRGKRLLSKSSLDWDGRTGDRRL